jgi:hypothetical protein
MKANSIELAGAVFDHICTEENGQLISFSRSGDCK